MGEQDDQEKMKLTLEIELGADDLEYYRKVMTSTWQRNASRDEKELIDGARRLLTETLEQGVPEYVRKRLGDLGTLIAMLGDPEWPLEPQDRRQVVAAISYFAEPVDLIGDKIPGLGFLDDALIAELVIRDLTHELEGYREFCEYRENEEARRGEEAHVSREDWLAAKRRQIFLRINRRRQEQRRHWSMDEPTDPILSYRS